MQIFLSVLVLAVMLSWYDLRNVDIERVLSVSMWMMVIWWVGTWISAATMLVNV